MQPLDRFRKEERPFTSEEKAQLIHYANFVRPEPRKLTFREKLVRLYTWHHPDHFQQRVFESLEESRPIYQAILDDGVAVIHTIRAKDVVVVHQYEDEGDSYFFDLGANLIYCHTCDPERDPPDPQWPNDHFTIRMARIHGLYYWELTPLGKRMTPQRYIHQTNASEKLWGYFPDPFEIIPGTLDSLRDALIQQHQLKKANTSES